MIPYKIFAVDNSSWTPAVIATISLQNYDQYILVVLIKISLVSVRDKARIIGHMGSELMSPKLA